MLLLLHFLEKHKTQTLRPLCESSEKAVSCSPLDWICVLLVAGFKCIMLLPNTLHRSILWFVKRNGKKLFGHVTLRDEPSREPFSKVFNSPTPPPRLSDASLIS